MPRLLRPFALFLLTGLVFAVTPTPADATYGGGYGGTSGSGIWAAAWWTGNPDGGGPYTDPPASGVDLCIWHDVGASVAALGGALAQASLPDSFWTEPLSGGHPGIWGVLNWATEISAKETGSDHFDLVACPLADEVPANGGDVQSAIPQAHPPGARPLYIWAFYDTVEDPSGGALPPVVAEAYSATDLPSPVLSTSPNRIDGVADATVVNLPTWLWIEPGIWHTYKATATAGGLVATVWAYPRKVTWLAQWDFASKTSDPQGGVSLGPELIDTVCDGPGAAYKSGALPGDPGACTATFSEPTFGTRRPLTAKVTWVVHWALSDSHGVVGGEGLYPDVTTRASLPLRVMQIESVITGG